MLHWRIEKPLDLGKSNYLVELPFNLLFLHSKDRAVKINVFASGQLRMKAGAYFEQ